MAVLFDWIVVHKNLFDVVQIVDDTIVQRNFGFVDDIVLKNFDFVVGDIALNLICFDKQYL